MSDDYPVKSLCEVLKVSRSGYYQWRAVPNSVRARQEALIQERIAQIHRASRGTYGSPRVAASAIWPDKRSAYVLCLNEPTYMPFGAAIE